MPVCFVHVLLECASGWLKQITVHVFHDSLCLCAFGKHMRSCVVVLHVQLCLCAFVKYIFLIIWLMNLSFRSRTLLLETAVFRGNAADQPVAFSVWRTLPMMLDGADVQRPPWMVLIGQGNKTFEIVE